MNEYLKRKEESITSYSIRLYKNRKNYGLTFQECGDLLNEVSGEDFSEAKWRRPVQHYLEIQEYLEQENPTGVDSDVLEEIELEKIELQKQQIRMRDQKRELNAIIRRQARLENLEDYFKEVTENFEGVSLPKTKSNVDDKKEAAIVISDWHIGMKFDGRFNTFNHEVAEQRIAKVKDKTLDTVRKENIDTLHIANLGDMISGGIHVSTRVQAEEDVIQQVIRASEYLKQFVKTFLDEGIQVKYYNIIGNHGRYQSNKSEVAGIEENFEKLILTILDTAFSNYDNYNSTGCRDGIIETEISGQKIILAHGDYDKSTNAALRLPQLFSYVPNYIITGHIHHSTSKDFGVTEHIVNPSLIGSDDYATGGRFGGKPGQKLILFNETDIESITTIKL
ncbi:MAG TPA: hypothetical protein K8V14_05965 [Staphylococcus ureilyticus]|uniref:hypothetical protein n=1 Tax=Staphylococcus ureilyticus TaxID=94138 RepID=UPI001D8B8E6A|nr:hypothetical protein [Staphylococcus ureilyticus]HJG66844.1 hypothetical protein [Staphylococcus ureilyticus]